MRFLRRAACLLAVLGTAAAGCIVDIGKAGLEPPGDGAEDDAVEDRIEEADVDVDGEPAGECGPHAQILGGECECESGFANCNEMWDDGCEVDRRVDPENCGNCDNACDDGVVCTSDTCGNSACAFPPRAWGTLCEPSGALDYCDGAGNCVDCLENGHCDDLNPCTADTCEGQVCDSEVRPDMSSCPGGVCCGGQCMTPGDCCSNQDCTGCGGVAAACTSFGDEAACESQVGCGWVLGFCFGDPDPCEAFTGPLACLAQLGCRWSLCVDFSCD
jgi:hypothetical protein